MRKLMIILLNCLVFMLISFYSTSSYATGTPNYILRLFDNMGDSAKELLQDHTCLIFTRGHIGTEWSAIIEQDNGYTILSGSSEDKVPYEPKIEYLDGRNGLLSFVMDTVSSRAISKNVDSFDDYDPFQMELTLLSGKKEVILKINQNKKYQGENAQVINEILGEIMYFMLWNASSQELRKRLPIPNIYLSLSPQGNNT